MQAVLAFGMHGPRRLDGKPRADESRGECIPRFDALVREHDGEDALGPQDAVHFAERRRHLALVILLGQVLLFAPHALKASRIGHGFVVFVGQLGGSTVIL
jgi:hypothetical protein